MINYHCELRYERILNVRFNVVDYKPDEVKLALDLWQDVTTNKSQMRRLPEARGEYYVLTNLIFSALFKPREKSNSKTKLFPRLELRMAMSEAQDNNYINENLERNNSNPTAEVDRTLNSDVASATG
ncbi:hypothetical protein J6590_100430 [Homalodisca vitripennis]|nr:hypothetical protein J6590_100430 [Homalodisca vitripennis]